MDFNAMKKSAQELKHKAISMKNSAVKYGTTKLADSNMSLKKIEDLEVLREKSKNKKTKISTGEEKEFIHRSAVLFLDFESDFFSQMLVSFPILQTKAYSQNMPLKLMDIYTSNLQLSEYKVTDTPAFVIFENSQVYKVITGEENIQKVVKSASLDINTTIDEL